MNTELTPKQAAILDYITDRWAKGSLPSITDIGIHFGTSSRSGVLRHLNAIVEKGFITKSVSGTHLSISLTKKAIKRFMESQDA